MNKGVKTYTLEDFLTDDTFIDWVKAPNPDLDAFWKNWLKQHPSQEEVLLEAIDFVSFLNFEESAISAEQVHNLKRNIDHQISKKRTEKVITHNNWPEQNQFDTKWALSNWYKVAAVLVGLLFLGGITYRLYWAEQLITHHTAYGQTLQVQLPDRSVVNLNGNSTLQYAANWPDAQTREVWLQGEAFFSVVHTPQQQKFLVWTSDEVNVEVLGTEFNVSTRKSRTRVVLSSGKVKLNIKEAQQTDQVTLKPGELVELTDQAPEYLKKPVNTQVYTSWRNKVLIFDNTPLPEVVLNLKDTYGLDVQLVDASLSEMKVSGSTPIDNLEVFFAGLSKTFGLQITQTGNQVVIRKEE